MQLSSNTHFALCVIFARGYNVFKCLFIVPLQLRLELRLQLRLQLRLELRLQVLI